MEEIQELYLSPHPDTTHLSHFPFSASSFHFPMFSDMYISSHSRYATARDEFEIASEETEKKSVYAADDRAAAREELAKLKAAFDDAIDNSRAEVGAEIRTRVGQRIRELERAVEAMEEMAKED